MEGGVAKLFSLRLQFAGLVIAAGGVVVMSSVFGLLGPWGWFFDLFSHFRVQYACSLALAAVVLAMLRWRKTAWFFGAVALFNTAFFLPLFFGKPPINADPATAQRVMLMNVNTATGQPKLVAAAIGQFAPDILVLEEVNDKWLLQLSDALRLYPHRDEVPRDDNFGIALYSKHPLADVQVHYLGEAAVPTISATVISPRGRFTVIATHPLPPAGGEYTRLRNEQLAELAVLAKILHAPLLMMGDLNVSPWNHQFKNLVAKSGLQNSLAGRGLQPSWPANLPIFLIPLDHCLHSPTVQIFNRQRGPNVASDHYPLIVDFSVTAP